MIMNGTVVAEAIDKHGTRPAVISIPLVAPGCGCVCVLAVSLYHLLSLESSSVFASLAHPLILLRQPPLVGFSVFDLSAIIPSHPRVRPCLQVDPTRSPSLAFSLLQSFPPALLPLPDTGSKALVATLRAGNLLS